MLHMVQQFKQLYIIDIATTFLLFFVSSLIFVLVAGIITQLERKFLAILQQRHGPVIVGNRGILQFLADAIKVLLKEVIFLNNSPSYLVSLMPLSFFFINVWVTFTLT